MSTTRLSSTGQIIIPKNIRQANAWDAGTEFEIEQRDDVLLLRAVAAEAGKKAR